METYPSHQLARDGLTFWLAHSVCRCDNRAIRLTVCGCFDTAGPHQTGWNGLDDKGTRVSPGVYVARVRIGDSTKQFLLTVLR